MFFIHRSLLMCCSSKLPPPIFILKESINKDFNFSHKQRLNKTRGNAVAVCQIQVQYLTASIQKSAAAKTHAHSVGCREKLTLPADQTRMRM